MAATTADLVNRFIELDAQKKKADDDLEAIKLQLAELEPQITDTPARAKAYGDVLPSHREGDRRRAGLSSPRSPTGCGRERAERSDGMNSRGLMIFAALVYGGLFGYWLGALIYRCQ